MEKFLQIIFFIKEGKGDSKVREMWGCMVRLELRYELGKTLSFQLDWNIS